jgi:hypothetical protein
MPLFRSRDDFELDNPHRFLSPESDYGVHWRTSAVPNVRWRVSYIQYTGEVYAIAQTPPFEVWLMGTVPPDPVDETVPFARRQVYYRTLDTILTGWADPRVSAFDLDWIVNRLAAVRSAP